MTGLSYRIRPRRERKTNTTFSIENEVNGQCIQWSDFHIKYWRARQKCNTNNTFSIENDENVQKESKQKRSWENGWNISWPSYKGILYLIR